MVAGNARAHRAPSPSGYLPPRYPAETQWGRYLGGVGTLGVRYLVVGFCPHTARRAFPLVTVYRGTQMRVGTGMLQALPTTSLSISGQGIRWAKRKGWVGSNKGRRGGGGASRRWQGVPRHVFSGSDDSVQRIYPTVCQLCQPSRTTPSSQYPLSNETQTKPSVPSRQ